ncbi:hypothetical protein ColTof4_06886 [Colletotrichum tofieldiae]|nr:hypothetical protein ColTof3_11833 [Colletotrichum tofieldiae]GKT74463.1 hypothetical protein ColTof4_06886 [Colletotrichum tofieldiae]GKT91640.1 hypothetical protein Ct61P_09490 [Colletotrichum tofieldiae]
MWQKQGLSSLCACSKEGGLVLVFGFDLPSTLPHGGGNGTLGTWYSEYLQQRNRINDPTTDAVHSGSDE